MALRLVLAFAVSLWLGCSFCRKREGHPVASSQPRVRCQASRYPVAVDCSWTLPPTPPNSTRPTSFIATYRLGVAAHGESWPCLQQTPEATSCVIPDVQMFSMVPYVLNITAVHPGGVSSSFVPFVPEHITIKSKEAQTLTTMWTDPENTMLSERSRHGRTHSQTGSSRRRVPEPPPWAAAVGAMGAPPDLALPRDLLPQVPDPLQASWGCSLPSGGAN